MEHPDTGGLEMEFEGLTLLGRASVNSCIIRGDSVGSDISLGLTTRALGFISTFRCKRRNYYVILSRLRSLALHVTAIFISINNE